MGNQLAFAPPCKVGRCTVGQWCTAARPTTPLYGVWGGAVQGKVAELRWGKSELCDIRLNSPGAYAGSHGQHLVKTGSEP